MDPNILLVLCLTGLIGLGVPAMLYAGLHRGNQAGQIELLHRASRQVGKPWQKEDESLVELGKQVEALREKTDPPS